jgi:hypothetical protein
MAVAGGGQVSYEQRTPVTAILLGTGGERFLMSELPLYIKESFQLDLERNTGLGLQGYVTHEKTSTPLGPL